jgi:hypothetical protein
VGIGQRDELCRAQLEHLVGDHIAQIAIDRLTPVLDHCHRSRPRDAHPFEISNRDAAKIVRTIPATQARSQAKTQVFGKFLHRLTVVMEKPRNKPADCSLKSLDLSSCCVSTVRSSGCHPRPSTLISHAVTASQRELAEIYLIPETGGKTRT